ncbi:SDR family NAD(P)-dependent oxidoreductase [Roseomonas haemaphysalidis]|uniref:Glucose 1-dehydrogenase n=1 Tax=Roseomonas haemaphysalidis TaxID=2768162 RepID=A0ABS3KQZ5_9PROT|nr:glucose 1-dehydrogenase [Roseomonas haemaphysalidis]MBO1078771.1 glucose 1-dehydrogenase [Roseomonas haemaphysalidis]
MTGRFAGRVAAITGAASGLGRAVAEALAAEGARLLLMDRDAAGLEALAARCPDALTVVIDVSSAADMARAAAAGLDRFGPASLLVTAAGMLGPTAPAVEAEEADWDRLFDVNVKGTWLAAKCFIPQIRAAGGGAVVTLASAAGLTGSLSLPAYSASKGAVVMLSRSLALAHAPEGIRVNCVCPGSIETPMLDATFAAAADPAARMAEFRARHPLGRFGQAREVADTVLFLLGEGAGFVTGVSLPVDGGRLA